MSSPVKEKVSLLEETLNRFILHTDKALYQLGKAMQDFKDEMKDFKVEMKESKGGMKTSRDEIKESKNEIKDFKEEMKADRKEMNIKWCELCNKLGTFAEDIAAPHLPRFARDYFNAPHIQRFATSLRASPPNDKSMVYEFDAVAETAKKVFLLETKFTVREKYLDQIPIIVQNFQICYPEYADKELIVLFASMKLHENTIKRLTKMGIYAMAMGDETMDLLNFNEVQKKI